MRVTRRNYRLYCTVYTVKRRFYCVKNDQSNIDRMIKSVLYNCLISNLSI